MATDVLELERLSRDDLVEVARKLGVQRPEVLTRVELKDEIVRLTETDDSQRRRSRGWLGVARDLLASVVEQGLHMPDAAALIRGGVRFDAGLKQYPPVATVTLAEIYASQGHARRAIAMLDEVLAREPEHKAARALRAKLALTGEVAPAREAEPEPELEATSDDEQEEEEELREEARADAWAPPAHDATSDEAEAEEAEAEAAEAEAAEAEAAEAEAAEAGVEAVEEAEAAQAEAAEAEAAEAGVEAVEEAEAAQAEAAEAGVEAVEEAEAAGVEVVEEAGVEEAPAPSEPEPEPEVDAVVTVHDVGGHLFVYWEVTAETLQRRDTQPVVRLALFQPSWDGAQSGERDFPVEGVRGSRLLVGMERGVLARAALGFRSPAGFVPVAVGVELDSDVHEGPSVRWTPPGHPKLAPGAWQRALRGYLRDVAEHAAGALRLK